MTEELKQVSGESETVADTGVMDGAALQTDEDTVIEGSTGAASVMGQVARLINPPPAGQTDVIRLAPGERFELATRSEEHTSELQSLMRISYAVFFLNTKNNRT